MSNKEVISKLRNELENLKQKIINLQIFLETKKYKKLEEKQQLQASLLKKQLEAMKQYQNILITRIALIQDLIDKESGE